MAKLSVAQLLQSIPGKLTKAHEVDAPRVPPQPALPSWTCLDRAGDGGVALLGTPDGRVVLALSMQGQWRADDFQAPTPADSTVSFKGSIIYRHTYDGARKVVAAYQGGLWYVQAAEDTDPRSIGRVTMALDEDAYAERLADMAREVVEAHPPGIDPEATTRSLAALLLMVAKHSFTRGWKEIGYGYWG